METRVAQLQYVADQLTQGLFRSLAAETELPYSSPESPVRALMNDSELMVFDDEVSAKPKHFLAKARRDNFSSGSSTE